MNYVMNTKLLNKHHLEFLSLQGGCRGSSESIHVKKCHIVGNLMSRLICKIHKVEMYSDLMSQSLP